MDNKVKNYIFLVLVHVLLGVLIYILPILSKVYAWSIILGGLYFVIKTKNKNNEVLYAAAYIVGSEVFLRMTFGNPNHEFSKYGVMIFLGLGMYYSGASKNAVSYWIYLILLIPGVIIATQTLSLDAVIEIRKTIAFNISGPVCLGFAAIYCYNRSITLREVNNLLLLIGLPILSCSVYLILFTPDLSDIVTGTSSNTETSGGFGPNQVSTALGFGMFIFFSRIILESKNKIFFIINVLILVNISYRGLITFSRGGMLTGFFMIIVFLLFLFFYSKSMGKLKLIYLIGFLSVAMSVTWVYTESATGGLIGKRYGNKDALGRVKDSRFTGREELASDEINMFLENPFFGIGTGKGTEIRTVKYGYVTASHDEITRMLAEHGSLGILALLILTITPLILYLDNKQHIYMLCFLFFWLFTINHAAMRTAAPSFVYALSLLKVKFDE
jgi:hypothetical protein